MAVAVDMLVTMVEEGQVVLHHLVHTALQLVEMVVTQITHMKVDMVEMPVVETSIYLAVVAVCHMVHLTKTLEVLVSGIEQVHIITTPVQTLRLLMDSGGQVVHMVTTHKTHTHTETLTVVQVA